MKTENQPLIREAERWKDTLKKGEKKYIFYVKLTQTVVHHDLKNLLLSIELYYAVLL